MDAEHAARLTVAEHAADAAELAMLLAMLGLIEAPVEAAPTGRPRRYGRGGCGTRAGFQRHQARGQTPCARCEDAQRVYMRNYARNRYTSERRRRQYEAAKARGYYARSA